jgi:putative transposase
VVDHSIDADATVAALDKIVGHRDTHTAFIRCDNGPELTATLCGTGATSAAPAPVPSSPVRLAEPWVESRGSMRELLAIEQFDTLFEALVLVTDWRHEYNDCRPHSALRMLTPTTFTRQWRTNHQPQPS